MQLLRLFDQDNFGAEFFETAAMRVEIALECEDSDFHGCSVVRRWSSSVVGRSSLVVGQNDVS